VAKRHVVAENLHFDAVFDKLGHRVVGESGFVCIVQLDVGEFAAPDDAFLGLGGQAVPRGQVVQVFLDHHIAAAREVRILDADERR
jgi:hypothetical protein